MAIYRLHLKHITRSRGLSAQAHARYITRNDHRSVSPTSQQALEKERSASAHAAYLDRSTTAHAGAYRDDLVYVEHGNMPAWAQESPQAFWKAADIYERTNGRLYSEMEVAIPRELAPHDRVALVRAFVQLEIGNRHPYSCAIHNSTALDGGEQPHAHIMFSERRLDGLERSPSHFFARADTQHPARGGTAKDRAWNARGKVLALRQEWEQATNHAFARAGLALRVDHRSLADQGIDRTPEPKMGTDHTAMLQRGDMTETTAEVMHLRKDRAHAARLARAIETTTRQLDEAKRVRAQRHARAQDLLQRARDPEAARERLHASRTARLEAARAALEHASGLPQRLAQPGEDVTGVAKDRVDLGRQSFLRIEHARDASHALVPWHDDFHALMGKMLRVSVSEAHRHRRTGRLVRILDHEHERHHER